MSSHPVLLVPYGAGFAALPQTTSVLDSHRIGHHVETETAAIVQHVQTDRPALVIVQGGRSEPRLVRLVEEVADAGSYDLPVLALIEQLSEADEAHLLQAGARDVLPAPATPTRLRSRILSMRRYAMGSRTDQRWCTRGSLAIDLGRREVTVGERALSLTRSEFDLLAALAQDPRRVMTRDELAVHLGAHSSPRALESHLSRLRAKVAAAQGPRVVESVRGVGYRLGVS